MADLQSDPKVAALMELDRRGKLDPARSAAVKELARRAQAQQQPQNQDFWKPLGQGLKEGALRQPVPPGAPINERLGAGLTRYGPAVLGSAAAGMVAPESLLGSAAMQYAGTTLGEGAGLGFSKAMGGQAPPAAQIPWQASKTGLGAALVDLGVGIPAKFASMLPEIAQTFMRIPSEAIKRAVKNPDIIPTRGGLDQLAVETRGIQTLARIQDSIEGQRVALGGAVDRALEDLHVKTQGKKVFDVGPLADHIKDYMVAAKQVNDSTVRAAASEDLKKILNIVQSMKESPMKSARAMVQIRRELDSLSEYTPAGLPKIGSDVGQVILKKLAGDFRGVINGASELVGAGKLTSANAAFHRFAQDYDEVRPFLGTKDQGRDALIKRFNSMEGYFNAGGVKQDILDELGRKFPAVGKDVEALQDHMAAHAFTKAPLPTVSGAGLNLIRLLGSPQAVGAGIKTAAKAGAAKTIAKGVARGAGAAAGQSLEQPLP